VTRIGRREFVASWLWLRSAGAIPTRLLTVRVNVMFDQAANSNKGLGPAEVALFHSYQAHAASEFAVSGIRFDLHYTEGAYLREGGFAEIPDRFLSRGMINLFVTPTLRYDIDRNRTGGSSTGPRARGPGIAEDPFYKTFLGLREATATTLPHEYAHHFVLDTQRNSSFAGNFWSDLRNDYWLWRQRHGVAIPEFQLCANSEWVKVEQ
jgi:hypothetical protein